MAEQGSTVRLLARALRNSFSFFDIRWTRLGRGPSDLIQR